MFDVIYRYQGTIDRHQAVPLVEQRVRYLAHCKEQGAAEGTLQLTAQMMLVIIEELDLKAEGIVSRKRIVTAAERWATREPTHHNIKHARKARSHFVPVATQ
jgi:integrase/recombinase XerD